MRMVNKGPFMEFIREVVTETGANTETRKEISMPTSRMESLAVLIHSVSLELNSIADWSGDDSVEIALKDNDNNGATLNYDGVISSLKLQSDITTSGGGLSRMEKTEYFDPPVLYSKKSAWLDIKGISQANAQSASVKIGYTVDKVDKDSFISALVED